MRYGLFASGAAALFLLGDPALANPPDAQQPVQQQAPATAQGEVTDAHLETFAAIYVDMQALEQALTQEVAEAGSTEAAQAVHASAEEKMIGVIEDHGWTVDQYNTVAQAINSDPQLRMQAVALIDERS